MGLDVAGIGEVADLAKTVVSRIWPDKTAEEQAKLAGALSILNAQAAIDQAEAAHGGVNFRDGAGWVCVAAFALSALKAPIEWGAALSGHPVTLPAFDTSVTTDMLLGLLGLGGMHLYQATNGSK